MKAAELRDLAVEELGAKEREITDQLFRMRIQKSMGQLEAPEKIKAVRRDLARIEDGAQAETGAIRRAPAAMPSRGRANPRRGISVWYAPGVGPRRR